MRRLVLCACISASVAGCGDSPTSPTAPSPSSATVDSIVTSFRGSVVESDALVIDWPEALQAEIGFTVHMSPDARMTIYLCVMEAASTIGVGACIALSATVKELQDRGNARMGISSYRTDGMPAETRYVYVAIAEGVLPWRLTGVAPPRRGDVFPGGERVLVTSQVPRTVTFRR